MYYIIYYVPIITMNIIKIITIYVSWFFSCPPWLPLKCPLISSPPLSCMIRTPVGRKGNNSPICYTGLLKSWQHSQTFEKKKMKSRL